MKIALISDLHFGKYSTTQELSLPGEKIQDTTTGAVSLIQSFTSQVKELKVDYLFVAGDLTSTGSPIEYARCINEIYKIADELDINRNNVIIGIGNHDIDRKIANLAESESISDPNYPLHESKLLYHRVASNYGETYSTELNFDEKGPAAYSGVIIKDDIIIVVLNSAWGYSPDSQIKHGKLEKEQLDWYKTVAEKISEETKWKIVLLHHHPFNYSYPTLGRDVSLLEEGAELLEISGNAGINLICHGHRHHPKISNEHHSTWKNPITFICTGSFSVNAAHRIYGRIPNVYSLLELNDDIGCKTITISNFEYSISNGWEPIRANCPETPIDSIMIFERPYDTNARHTTLRDLIQHLQGTPYKNMPSWSELPLQLKTMNYKNLNEALREVASDEYIVVGEYPKQVALLRRSE